MELSNPVKSLLKKNGYEVYSEINDCDIAAMKNEQLIIVELKTKLSMNLLFQAMKRQKITDYVFIAVPKLKMMDTKKWKDYKMLIKRLGLGLIVVYLNGEKHAEVEIEPDLKNIISSLKKNKNKQKKLGLEFHGRSIDVNVAGSTRRKIMTAYKEASLYIATCLSLYGELSPKQCRLLGSHPKKTNSILNKNYNHWFIHVRKGCYNLSLEGKKALENYAEIVGKQKEIIQNNKIF